jgi:hypothetical protein
MGGALQHHDGGERVHSDCAARIGSQDLGTNNALSFDFCRRRMSERVVQADRSRSLRWWHMEWLPVTTTLVGMLLIVAAGIAMAAQSQLSSS